jgi:DNA-binding beta-propeller fold protein YncE
MEMSLQMRTILFGFMVCLVPAIAQTDQLLHQVQTLPLAKIEGHLGHMAVDVKGERLFVAATEANTVEVFDLKQGTLLRSVAGFDKPEEILFVPGPTRAGGGKVFVSNADGKLRSFDTAAWQQAKATDLGGAGGALRYDASAKRIYAGFGAGIGEAGLAVIDPVTGAKLSEITLAGRSASFQLEKTGSRIFINVPGANEVAVANRNKPEPPAKVSVTWAKENYTMALDEGHHRLLVGTRNPVKILVLDTTTLQWVTELPLANVPHGEEFGDMFYDALQKRVYVVSGSAIVPPDHTGLVYVLDQTDPDHYVEKQKLVTALGAHTGLFVPELHRLFVAVPRAGNAEAAVRVYETK